MSSLLPYILDKRPFKTRQCVKLDASVSFLHLGYKRHCRISGEVIERNRRITTLTTSLNAGSQKQLLETAGTTIAQAF